MDSKVKACLGIVFLLMFSSACIASSVTVLGSGNGPNRAVHDLDAHFTVKPSYNISAISFIKPLFNSTLQSTPLLDISNRTPFVPYRNINPFNEYRDLYLIEPRRSYLYAWK